MGGARLGVLGGTFDPIHLGHLILAQEAMLHLGLDRVLLVPVGDPWRKTDRIITPAAHRLAMVRLAAAQDPRLQVSTLEIDRPGPSYTADTLAQLRQERGMATVMFFIMGGDALLDFPNWHEPERIIALANLAVALRPGWPALTTSEMEKLVPGLSARVVFVPMPTIDISASALRQRARRGLPLRYLVLPTVEEYILQHRLYVSGTAANV